MRARSGGREWLSGQAFQNRKRREFRLHQGMHRHDTRLLQRILAGYNRMSHLIGKRNPCRTGRKRPLIALPGLLVRFIALQIMVEIQHELVIRGAVNGAKPDQMPQFHGLAAQVRPRSRHPVQARFHCIPGRQMFKIVRSSPNPVLVRVHVGERA